MRPLVLILAGAAGGCMELLTQRRAKPALQQGSTESGWHQANADALFKNLHFIRESAPTSSSWSAPGPS